MCLRIGRFRPNRALLLQKKQIYLYIKQKYPIGREISLYNMLPMLQYLCRPRLFLNHLLAWTLPI